MPPARATAIRHVRWLGVRLARLRRALGRRWAALARLRRRPAAVEGEARTSVTAELETQAGGRRAAAPAPGVAAPSASRAGGRRSAGRAVEVAAEVAEAEVAAPVEVAGAETAAAAVAAAPEPPARPRGLADLRRPWATPMRPRLRSAIDRARHGLGRVAHGVVVGARAMAQALVAHRLFLLSLAHRALWWAALALFVIGARGLLDPAAGPIAAVLPYFVIGFSLSAAAILIADTRRIRWAALALGFGHGALGLVVWGVLQSL